MTVEGIDFCCIINDINKSRVIDLLEKSVLVYCGLYKMHTKNINIKNWVCECFGNLIKPKKLETKGFL